MLDRKKKRVLFQICAFLIPFILLSMFLFFNGSSYHDLLISDANEQYSHLFQYLKNILDGQESIFYSFSKGLGGSMYGTFFYYLSSPWNLFLLFVPHQYIFDFMGFLMVFKISLSGFTMFYYLKGKNNYDFINFILSLSFALMSYHIMYFFNIMWLDAVYLLPLIIKGLDRILDNKKSTSYIIFLFFTILANYYIAYMVCIFLVIYFCYRIFTLYNIKNDKEIMWKITKKFFISSFLGGCLAAFMILPVLNELSASTRELLFYGGDTIFNRSMSVIFQTGIQKQSTQALYSVPYFFCGYFVFSILINFFFVKKKNIGKKAVLIMLVIFFLSIVLKPLIYVWHGFTYPILFTNRWTFVVSFFLIVTASEKYQYLEYLTNKKMILFTLLFLMISIFSYFVMNEEFNGYLFLINGFFCFANLLLLNIILTYRSCFYKVGLLLLFLIEILIVLKLNFLTMNSFKEKDNLLSNQTITSLNEELEKVSNEGYRIGGSTIYQKNELFNTDFSRINHFLSTVNGRITNFLKKAGYSSSSSDFDDHKDQYLMNALLGVRYWYNENSSFLYEKENVLHLEKEIPIYESSYIPTIGYMVDKVKIKLDESNPFAFQNSVLKLIGYKPVFERKKVIKLKDNEYQIQKNKEEQLYFYITEKGNNDYPKKIILNNKEIKEKYFTYLGILKISVNADETAYYLKIDGKGKIDDVFVYTLDIEKMKQVLQELQKRDIENIIANKNQLQFDVSVQDGKRDLLLTIPYEGGWHIYVDGKKTSYKEFMDTFITIPLNDGNHHIKMIYIPKFLFIGIMISFISLIFTICYVKRKGNVKSIDN